MADYTEGEGVLTRKRLEECMNLQSYKCSVCEGITLAAKEPRKCSMCGTPGHEALAPRVLTHKQVKNAAKAAGFSTEAIRQLERERTREAMRNLATFTVED